MLELPIQKAVIKYARSRGWFCMKFASPGYRGVPDYLLLKRSGTSQYQVMFMEFKSTTGKPSKLQLKIIGTLRNLNVPVYVVNSIEYGLEIIDEAEIVPQPGR